ncbi:mRNA surveillance protein pelota [archaeon]|nr:MAG: mRNA surveillance protein pelota [archaeon]
MKFHLVIKFLNLKILSYDEKRGIIKLVPRFKEDLWTLYQVIEKDDLVSGFSHRVIKTVGGNRVEKTKVKVWLTLKVLSKFLDLESNMLKLDGIVMECPEDLEGTKGHRHSLVIQPGNKYLIRKRQWLNYQLKQLYASRHPSVPLIVIAMDREEATLALIETSGFSHIQRIHSEISSKRYASENSEQLLFFLSSIVKAMKQIEPTREYYIVIVGPGFIKNKLATYLQSKYPDLWKRVIYLGFATSGTISGIKETLRSGVLRNVQKKLRIIEENVIIQDFLIKIAKNHLATYGYDNVKYAIEMRAVQKLLITDDFLANIGDEERREVENIFQMVEENGGEIIIINSKEEPGKILKGFGGIAAILRFNIGGPGGT